MSQVGFSRPASQLSQGARVGVSLPEIPHPLSRMSNPGKMDVRGSSQMGRPGSHPTDGRPLAAENAYLSGRRSVSAASRQSHRISSFHPPQIDSIPEGVEVKFGDPTKARLPVFGSRAGIADRNGAISRASSRMSQASTQARLEIDELEALIKEKLKSSYYEVRKRFRDNDPEGKGNVSKDALCRILVTILGRPVNPSQYSRLLERLRLADKTVISFSVFYAAFRDAAETSYPQWMDMVQHQGKDRVTMSANQVHTHLKQRAKQKFMDMADLIPQMNPGGTGRIMKHEFKQMLNRMSFFMDEDEFDRLWNRYDADGEGVVRGERLLKSLGIEWRNGSADSKGRLSPIQEAPNTNRSPRRRDKERRSQLDVERWLKEKFREGFYQMKECFEERDVDNKGVVGFDDFLEVLGDFGLKLEKGLLGNFLSRCSIKAVGRGVPYREFLHRFQDRGEHSMTHTILVNAKHRFHKPHDIKGSGATTLSTIESQLMNMFQRDFLALLSTFKGVDKLGTDRIAPEEFRAAIESRFNLELSDQQYEAFLDRVPIDDEGLIKYAEFMQQFDTRGMAPSLFNKPPPETKAPKPVPAPVRSNSPERPAPEPAANGEVEGKDDVVGYPAENFGEDEDDDSEDSYRRRVPQELFRNIKALLTARYQDVERAFYELDETNTKRLTQETMYQLLKRFNLKPEVTRGEIRDLWKTFITNQDRTLDFLQFVRHFGFSMRSAAFPNAKHNPPRRGDADFMLRSRKLNCASDMLQDNLRAKVDYMWDDLRREFVAMDPYGTGFISAEEFREILTELCVQLSAMELDMLCRKFDLKSDGRVNYVEFLKPFALRKQVWRHGNDMMSLLKHPQPELPIPDIVEPPQKGLHGITAKLRQKLAGDWKNLRRAFKKIDKVGEGYLTLPEFRSVLKLANVVLDEDEVYHVMSEFDRDMTGKISYKKFIEETFKPESRRSITRSGEK